MEIVQTEVVPVAPRMYPCASCDGVCANPGALSVHMTMKHPEKTTSLFAKVEVPKQVDPKSKKNFEIPLPFWKQVFAIGLCYVAIMSPARTVFNLALRAPLKRDRRRFNKGKDNRTRWTYHQKASAIEEFEEFNIQKFVSQEEFCSKHKFDQGTFAKWRLKKKGGGEE